MLSPALILKLKMAVEVKPGVPSAKGSPGMAFPRFW